MNNVSQLQRQYLDFLTSLYREGLLNRQFQEVQSYMSGVTEMITFFNEFFEVAENDMRMFDTAIEQENVDSELDAIVHRFNGSNLSVGTPRVASACLAFRNCYETNNFEGCLTCLKQVKSEYCVVKGKLQTLFSMQHQIVAAGGSVPN